MSMRLSFGIPDTVYIGESRGENLAKPLLDNLRYAIDRGVNHVDIGDSYGISPDVSRKILTLVKDALSGGYREKARLAVSVSAIAVDSREELDRRLNFQLDTLGEENVDCIIVRGLTRNTWAALKELGLPLWLAEKKEAGTAASFAFTFHDDSMYLRDIIGATDLWDVCGIDLSFMDGKHHPGLGGARFITESGLDMFVHSPTKNERLLVDGVAYGWEDAGLSETDRLAYCLRYVLNNAEVKSVVTDFSSSSNLREAINLADTEKASPGCLGIEDELKLAAVKEKFLTLRPIACTGCGCCMPCSLGIDIPQVIELYHDALMYSDVPYAAFAYEKGEHVDAECVGCGQCSKRCPRRFAVGETVTKAQKLFGEALTVAQA